MNGVNLNGKPLLVFTELITENGNETKAYQNVYKCKYKTANKNAHQYMVKNGILKVFKEYINKMSEKVSQKAEVTLEEIIENARFVINNCKEKPDNIDKLNLIRANEQLGKIIGAFKEVHKKEIELSDERKKQIEDLINDL